MTQEKVQHSFSTCLKLISYLTFPLNLRSRSAMGNPAVEHHHIPVATLVKFNQPKVM
uniref:Uncharacterized protein n=1 Tax=Anguilla anguilla TaxID=7936 RepID=A0A0E9RSE7_ANGAN